MLLWVPFVPHHPLKTPTRQASTSASPTVGCFRCVSMCVCVRYYECVYGWGGVVDLPPSLSALKQSSFEMTSEQKPVCYQRPSPASHDHSSDGDFPPASFIQDKCHYTPTPPPPYLPIQLYTTLTEVNIAWSTPSIPCY